MNGWRWTARAPMWRDLKPRARVMRKDATAAESLLWGRLRGRGLDGFRFRRQHAVGPYIVDFLCAKRGLAIELDGRSHEGREEEDRKRQTELEAAGLRVLRFTNAEVLGNLEAVADRIREALRETSELPLR